MMRSFTPIMSLATRYPNNVCSSRNFGGRGKKSCNLNDAVRGSKHIWQTGVLIRDILSFLFERAFLSSRSNPMATLYKSIWFSMLLDFPPAVAAKSPAHPLMSLRASRSWSAHSRPSGAPQCFSQVGRLSWLRQTHKAVSWLDRNVRIARLGWCGFSSLRAAPVLHAAQMLGLYWGDTFDCCSVEPCERCWTLCRERNHVAWWWANSRCSEA